MVVAIYARYPVKVSGILCGYYVTKAENDPSGSRQGLVFPILVDVSVFDGLGCS